MISALMKYIVVALTLLLAILHHDAWYWDDSSLVFGFLPVGLAWHAGISIACSIVGYLAVLYCWPKEFQESDDADPKDDVTGGSQ